ncbi:MAG TPA: S41 family peptidase [Gemmataceae bacterium]|jgi:C-terminal processing protease CtpA/Prc
MRVCLSLSAALLVAVILAAAPAPSPTPPPPPPPPSSSLAQPDDADAFANTLLAAVNWVVDIYVRPVKRADLLETALTALYDAARRPVPSDLRRRIDRAEKQAADLSLKEADMAAPLVPGLMPRRAVVPDDRPILELIRAVRAETGKAEEIAGEPPLRLCCRVMLRSLDPYSGIITPAEENRANSLRIERDGFGLDVPETEAGRVVVKDVLPGGPAQRAGLRAGDEILRVHDSDGRARKMQEALPVLNGRLSLIKPELGVLARAEPIQVTFRRRGTKDERRVTLPWEHFRPESIFGVSRRDDNSWNYWLDPQRKIAHVRVGALVDATPDELSEIIAALREDGLRGLILDLRWCPGGLLKGSWRSAELFLGEGTIATINYRGQPEEVFRSVNDGKLTGFPIVVLINSDTIGGGELIAAALQDHHRAVLVGQRTYGKGNVQKLLGFGSIGLKVTSGTILRPDGKTLHRFADSKPSDAWGVHPDREFRVSAEVSRALKTWWEQQTYRPGSSTERLPLDDPLADPQRNAAIETLAELLKKN